MYSVLLYSDSVHNVIIQCIAAIQCHETVTVYTVYTMSLHMSAVDSVHIIIMQYSVTVQLHSVNISTRTQCQYHYTL